MRHKQLVLLLIFVLLSHPAHAKIFLGTVDGYVLNMTNGIVEGANVTATVNGCSGGETNGCAGSDVSQSNGYYVIANLNADPGDIISVSATAIVDGNQGSGSSSGTANEFQAARVNVSLCFSPSAPSLIDQEDTHNSSVNLYWNSGTDPFGFSTYDEFQLDSGPVQVKTSPVSLNVSYSSHTWRVRTCNTNGVTSCCSDFSEDSFTVVNNAPSPPSLVPQADTHNNSATLSWTNGTDPDGDEVYHQFQFDSQPVQNNSFSPVTITDISFGSHTWGVRACDFLVCGAWATDTFEVINSLPSAPVLVEQGNTQSSSVGLTWTSGTDPDGDIVHDWFQFGNSSDFSSLFYNDTNASHPSYISGLPSFEKYYWRVSSCDSEGCSDWASSSFVKYKCPPCEGEDIEERGEGKGSTEAQKIAERVIPSGPVEVLPEEPPEEEIEEEGEITEEAAEKEAGQARTPAGFAYFFGERVQDNLWWIFLVIIWGVIITLALIRRKKKKTSGHNREPLQK